MNSTFSQWEWSLFSSSLHVLFFMFSLGVKKVSLYTGTLRDSVARPIHLHRSGFAAGNFFHLFYYSFLSHLYAAVIKGIIPSSCSSSCVFLRLNSFFQTLPAFPYYDFPYLYPLSDPIATTTSFHSVSEFTLIFLFIRFCTFHSCILSSSWILLFFFFL